MLRNFFQLTLSCAFFEKILDFHKKNSHREKKLLMSSPCPKKQEKTLKSRWSHKAAAIGIELAKALKNANDILGN